LTASEQYDFNADITPGDDFTPVLVQGFAELSGDWQPAVVNYQSQSYGEFQEITVSISAVQVFESLK
jgi:protein subunit release factor A